MSRIQSKQRMSFQSDIFSNQSLKQESNPQLTNIKVDNSLEREEKVGVPKSQSHLLLQEKPMITKERNLDIQTSLQKSPNFGSREEEKVYKNSEQN